jgi:hypothetical protein
MSHAEALAGLSDRLYERYGTDAALGVEFYHPYMGQFAAFDPVEVLVHQFKTYPSPYGLDFLLATPQLWRGFTSADWLRLGKELSPRPDPRSLIEASGSYDDLVFLGAYLGLDVLSMPTEGALKIADYFRKFPDLLVADDADRENLDGAYFVSADDLDAVRARLLGEGIFRQAAAVRL